MPNTTKKALFEFSRQNMFYISFQKFEFIRQKWSKMRIIVTILYRFWLFGLLFKSVAILGFYLDFRDFG